MKTEKFLFVFLIISIFVGNVFSEENTQTGKETVLSLEDCIVLARENNISIKVQQNTLEDLKLKNSFSWNSVSPTLKGEASYSDNFLQDVKSFGVSGSVGLTLSTNLYSSIKGAKLNYENGILTYQQAVKQIELNVWKAFYGLIYKNDYYLFQKQNLETAKKNYEQNLAKFRSGKISELDVMTSQVNYEQKKPVVEEARIDLINNYQLFKQILGIPQDDIIKLDGSLDKFLDLKSIKLPEKDKPAPDIQAAMNAVEIAKNNLLAQRFSAYGPTITGSYKYGKTMNVDSSDWTTTNSFSIGVSIPLDSYLPWSQSAVSINTLKKNLDSARLKLQDAETSIKVSTDNYIRKIEQIIAMLEVSKQNVELAKKTYEMTEKAYNYGKTDFLTLQNAVDNVTNAEITLSSQAKTLLETLLDTEYLLGLDFGTILKLSNE